MTTNSTTLLKLAEVLARWSPSRRVGRGPPRRRSTSSARLWVAAIQPAPASSVNAAHSHPAADAEVLPGLAGPVEAHARRDRGEVVQDDQREDDRDDAERRPRPSPARGGGGTSPRRRGRARPGRAATPASRAYAEVRPLTPLPENRLPRSKSRSLRLVGENQAAISSETRPVSRPSATSGRPGTPGEDLVDEPAGVGLLALASAPPRPRRTAIVEVAEQRDQRAGRVVGGAEVVVHDAVGVEAPEPDHRRQAGHAPRPGCCCAAPWPRPPARTVSTSRRYGVPGMIEPKNNRVRSPRSPVSAAALASALELAAVDLAAVGPPQQRVGHQHRDHADRERADARTLEVRRHPRLEGDQQVEQDADAQEDQDAGAEDRLAEGQAVVGLACPPACRSSGPARSPGQAPTQPLEWMLSSLLALHAALPRRSPRMPDGRKTRTRTRTTKATTSVHSRPIQD